MAERTSIEWLQGGSTSHVVAGCTPVSKACENCWACRLLATRLKHKLPGLATMVNGKPQWTGKVILRWDKLREACDWPTPRRVFLAGMGDWGHPSLSHQERDQIMAIPYLAPQHTYLMLTKRPEVMYDYFLGGGWAYVEKLLPSGTKGAIWPPPNVHFGVSAEDQETLDVRVGWLLKIKAMLPTMVVWLSLEPLLGEVDLLRALPHWRCKCGAVAMPLTDDTACACSQPYEDGWTRQIGLDGVVVGAESGPGARPLHPAWVRRVRDDCVAAGVPFMFKGWGEWLPFCTEAHYAANSTMPGWGLSNAEIIGGDCGGPVQLENQSTRTRGRWLARWRDGRQRTVTRYITVQQHRWGKQNLLGQDYVWVGKRAAGRLLDGRTWDQLPEVRP